MGVDLILDDVTVRQTTEPLGPELVSNGGFESGTSGWFGFGTVTLSVSSNARRGAAALLTSARADTWQGPATSLTSLVTLGATYRLSGFARLVNASAATLRMTVNTRCDGVQGPAAGVELLADDVSVARRLAVPLLQPQEANNRREMHLRDGDVRVALLGWKRRRFYHGRAFRCPKLGGDGQRRRTCCDEFEGHRHSQTYNVSYWVNIGGADSATVLPAR